MATTNKPATTATTGDKAPPAEQPKKEARLVEFVPFGAKDKIQLSIEMVKRIVAVKTKSGKGCSDEDAFKFMLMCQARKLNPFEGDAFLIGYDNSQQPDKPQFSLITAHQAFLKRAEVHQEFDGMESGTIVLRKGEVVDLLGDWHMPQDNVLGGWATVYFKNRKYPMKKRLRLARFQKNYGIWKDDPAGMIVKCAEADALRSSFPTMLGGMFISEELPVVTATEIPHAQFEPPAPNGGTEKTVTQATVETPKESGDKMRKALEERKEPPAAAAPPPEKKEATPTLQRRPREEKQPEPAKPQAQATPEGELPANAREKLMTMLAVGGCTPADFVAVVVEEGWIDPEQGAWDKIPDERFAEFVKPDNWSLIMELLDEKRAAKPAATATPPKSAAPPGQLL